MTEPQLRIAAGVDVGTECVKAAIVSEDGLVIGRAVMPTRGYFQTCVYEVLAAALDDAQRKEEELAGLGSTGFGMDCVPKATHTATEAACHALGAFQHVQHAMTLVNIGGRDPHVITVDGEGRRTAARGARRDGARLVYDSHEIFGTWGATLAQPRWLRWAMIRWERRLARRAVAVVTINESIAAELRRRLGVRRVVVVHNCPARWTPPPVPEDRIRVAANIPANEPVVLCHGGFQAGRGLEETAAAMLQPGLERAHLVFLGYRGHVIDPILADGRLKGRAHYVPAVEPAEVVPWVAGADVDVMAILPVDRNSVLSTPNKLFESLAAGVPVVTSDLPERRRIVLDDADAPLGAVCDPADPASIATAIRWVLDQPPEERLALRARCLRAAHERWNWETESAGLLALYAGLSVGP